MKRNHAHFYLSSAEVSFNCLAHIELYDIQILMIFSFSLTFLCLLFHSFFLSCFRFLQLKCPSFEHFHFLSIYSSLKSKATTTTKKLKQNLEHKQTNKKTVDEKNKALVLPQDFNCKHSWPVTDTVEVLQSDLHVDDIKSVNNRYEKYTS